MTAQRKWPLVEALASSMFSAQISHTGMMWEDFARGDDDTSYHREARKVLEMWSNKDRPYVVLDLDHDEMWQAAEVPQP